MESNPNEQTTQPVPVTDAMVTFVRNWDRMGLLIGLLDKVSKGLAADEMVGPLGPSLLAHVARIKDLIKLNVFVSEWYVVMQVTFAEAYLQDVLEMCARADPDVMGDSKPSATYEQIRAADSKELIEEELRLKWARSFVDDGGPARWIKRLEKMGVRDYPADLAQTLEEAWGVRHVVVHKAGVATHDFVRRHPEFGATVNEPIPLKPERVLSYVKAISQFVEVTDRSFELRISASRGAAD